MRGPRRQSATRGEREMDHAFGAYHPGSELNELASFHARERDVIGRSAIPSPLTAASRRNPRSSEPRRGSCKSVPVLRRGRSSPSERARQSRPSSAWERLSGRRRATRRSCLRELAEQTRSRRDFWNGCMTRDASSSSWRERARHVDALLDQIDAYDSWRTTKLHLRVKCQESCSASENDDLEEPGRTARRTVPRGSPCASERPPARARPPASMLSTSFVERLPDLGDAEAPARALDEPNAERGLEPRHAPARASTWAVRGAPRGAKPPFATTWAKKTKSFRSCIGTRHRSTGTRVPHLSTGRPHRSIIGSSTCVASRVMLRARRKCSDMAS